MTHAPATAASIPAARQASHKHRPWAAIGVFVLGVVVMAVTAFFELIDEPQLPAAFVAAPIPAGLIAAAMAYHDKHLGKDHRLLWAGSLFFLGFLAVLVYLLLDLYVLPLHES